MKASSRLNLLFPSKSLLLSHNKASEKTGYIRLLFFFPLLFLLFHKVKACLFFPEAETESM